MFLKTIWNKGIKPFLLIAVIYFCTKFLINVFVQNESERFAMILIFGLAILFALTYLFELLFRKILSEIKSKLPESIKKCLRIIGKILNYIAPVILGIIIYRLWKQDSIKATVVVGIFVILRIGEIIKQEKQPEQ